MYFEYSVVEGLFDVVLGEYVGDEINYVEVGYF